jgi:hypothetical protein
MIIRKPFRGMVELRKGKPYGGHPKAVLSIMAHGRKRRKANGLPMAI